MVFLGSTAMLGFLKTKQKKNTYPLTNFIIRHCKECIVIYRQNSSEMQYFCDFSISSLPHALCQFWYLCFVSFQNWRCNKCAICRNWMMCKRFKMRFTHVLNEYRHESYVLYPSGASIAHSAFKWLAVVCFFYSSYSHSVRSSWCPHILLRVWLLLEWCINSFFLLHKSLKPNQKPPLAMGKKECIKSQNVKQTKERDREK